MDSIIDEIMKEANFERTSTILYNLERLLKLHLDDFLINKAMKIISLLDLIETSKDAGILEKNEIVDVKEKIRKSMSLFQEAIEDLFSIHQRLVGESEIGSSIKE